MLRRFGLLAGMILGLMVLVGESSAQKASVFTRKKPQLENTYGIQILGGGGMYSMTDVNDFRVAATHTSNDEDAEFGIAYGFAFLYRMEERMRFTIGYNVLGEDKTYASWPGAEFEQRVSGSELYLQYDYLFPIDESLTISLGIAPAIYSGSLDRTGTVGVNFADADGRTFGFRTGLGAEYLFGDRYAIHFMGGYRFAKVGEVTYEDRNGDEQVVYWGGSNRKFEVDLSGAFIELGLRVYFEPATDWIRF